jgi:hypothetical protein
MVASADSTLTFIRKKIRRLTASASESVLTTNDIDQYINNFYSQDFPYGIKLDQMRSVYTFYTRPYIDRYPLDVNYNQGIREPIYFEGIQGYFFKDRDQFFRMWPRWPTKFNPINGDGVTTSFNFTIGSTPFLSKEVVLGGTDANGNAISVADDGNGNLQLQVPNPVTTVPPYAVNGQAPIPGMHNQNNGNPGLEYQGSQPLTAPFFTNAIGTVDYVTGSFSINFPVAPASGTQITLWVSQYQTGRPYTLLFWNNEFTIRPIPKLVHKVEVETYLTPVQFMETTDNPILNQWAQYIAYGASREILRDRQDLEGVGNLEEGFKRQEALVLERQGVEEINQRNTTLYSSTVTSQGWNNGFGQGWY